MRASLLAVSFVASVAVGLRPAPAAACGGCFSPPTENDTVVTDHRMILSISPDQTTLYDQIKYLGTPSSFAWVLPISSVAQVGLSADLVFDSLDTITHTTVSGPPRICPPIPYCPGAGADGGAYFSDAGAGVQILTQEVIGPYETVQLKSSDPAALNTWLSSHGFNVPADVQPVIDAYVALGVDFLAMKLVPGASVQSMRPVRVTTQGASPSLPLRMVAAGTGSVVGITLWVLGEGRYEPQNFPFFRIQDSEIVWDGSTSSSNYAALRKQKEQASGNRAWELESSFTISQGSFKNLIQYGGYTYGYGYDAAVDYQPINAPDGGDGGETADQVRSDDLASLFHGLPEGVRVTRLRSDIGRAALDRDLDLTASPDQSELTNARVAESEINAPACPAASPCPAYDDGGGGVDTWGGGCDVASASNEGGNIVVFLGLGLVGFISFGRRKR